MNTFAYLLPENSDDRTRLLRYANGVDVPPTEVRFFIDKADTLKTPISKRPGGSRLFEELQPGDRIIFTDTDHFFSKLYPLDFHELISKWSSKNIEVVVVYPDGTFSFFTDPESIDLFRNAVETAGNMVMAKIKEALCPTEQ